MEKGLPGSDGYLSVGAASVSKSRPERDRLANSIPNFFSKASVSMSSQSNLVIEGASVLVRAEPGKTPDEAKVALGGTLKFENHFTDFPDFEIEFDPPGPPSASDKLTGTVHEPIFVHMPDADVTFRYHIVYKKRGSTTQHKHGPYRARSCPGCPANG